MTTFTTKARKLADPYWQGSFTHPFVTQLQEGTLAPEIFRFYLLQDRYYLEHFSKLYELIAKATNDVAIKAFMQENSHQLAEGEQSIRKEFFKELQITEAEIKETPIAMTAYNYVSHMYRQLTAENVAAAMAGMLPCPWLYQEIGERLVAGGSPNALYQRWIETYAHPNGARKIQAERQLIDHLYEQGTKKDQDQMLSAFYISSQMEYLFWEMAITKETWPKGSILYGK